MYAIYYIFAVFFKWTPSEVDELGVSFIAWLLERIEQDKDKLVFLR